MIWQTIFFFFKKIVKISFSLCLSIYSKKKLWNPCFTFLQHAKDYHKRHFSQFCFLMFNGLSSWKLRKKTQFEASKNRISLGHTDLSQFLNRWDTQNKVNQKIRAFFLFESLKNRHFRTLWSTILIQAQFFQTFFSLFLFSYACYMALNGSSNRGTWKCFQREHATIDINNFRSLFLFLLTYEEFAMSYSKKCVDSQNR